MIMIDRCPLPAYSTNKIEYFLYNYKDKQVLNSPKESCRLFSQQKMMLLERLTDFYCGFCHFQFSQGFYPDLFCPYDHIVCQRCADSVEIDLRRTRVDTSMDCPCCQTQVPRRAIMNLDFMHRLKVMAEIVIDMIRGKDHEIIELKRHVGGEINRRMREGRIKLTYNQEPQEMINQQEYISRQKANNSSCEPFTFRNLPSIEYICQEKQRVPLVESCFEMDEVWQMRRDIRISSSDVVQCQPGTQELRKKQEIYFSLKKPKRQAELKQHSPFVMLEPLFKDEQNKNEDFIGMVTTILQLQKRKTVQGLRIEQNVGLTQTKKNLNLRSRGSF